MAGADPPPSPVIVPGIAGDRELALDCSAHISGSLMTIDGGPRSEAAMGVKRR